MDSPTQLSSAHTGPTLISISLYLSQLTDFSHSHSTPPPPPPPPAMVTNPTNSPSRPKLESLTHVDITKLSQSELYLLSLCSSSTFDLHRIDDVIIPKIDRSIFNESAGSRRQTYSRLRATAAPRKPHQSNASGQRRRLAGLLPTPKPPPVPDNNPERFENRTIVSSLKKLIDNRPLSDNSTAMVPFVSGGAHVVSEPLAMVNRAENFVSDTTVVACSERKRKRGRKPNVKVDNGRVLDIVNKDGVPVDLAALANANDPFGEELRRRTAGLETEEEVLGFLRDLEGQWGSRRRKRKFVNASDFGDALPVGWKLLFGLRRREGRVWLYCRRYISPSGHQFVSCKEASSYLQFYFGQNDSTQLMDLRIENTQQALVVASGSHAGNAYKGEDLRQDIISNSISPSTLTSEYDKEIALLGLENLAEVQVRDLFECHKCNMVFDEKDTYLQHLLSSHQKTTRRYKVSSHVGDGVIVKDDKYECQFCHKIFEERRRYNSHVGIHVRNNVRRSEELTGQVTVQKSIGSPSMNDLQTRISKMDALIDTAQNSTLEASVIGHNEESSGDLARNELNALQTPEINAASSDRALNFDSSLSEPEMENSTKGRNLNQELNKQDKECVFPKKNVEIDTASNVLDSKMNPNIDTMAACNVLDSKMNPNMDTMAALSAEEKYTKFSVTSDRTDCVFSSTEEIDKYGIDCGRGSEIHLPSPPESTQNWDVYNSKRVTCIINSDHPEFDAMDELIESKREISLGIRSVGADINVVNGTLQQNSDENELPSGIPDSVMPLMQSLSCLPTYFSVSAKGEGGFSNVDQKFDNVTGFEELKLDEIQPFKFDMTAQESPSLPQVSMNMENDADIASRVDSKFDSEEVLLNMAGRHQCTTVCVWCSNEFNHEPLHFEIESDSVGFMCPTCKVKISGQLNVFNSSFFPESSPFLN